MELKDLYYGQEVLIRKGKDSIWMTHWFEHIGRDGFYSTENQGSPARFVAEINPINSSMSGEKGEIKDQIDFEEIKQYLSINIHKKHD